MALSRGAKSFVLTQSEDVPAGVLTSSPTATTFTRADEARTEGGAGLGLAIAHVIVEAHGGSAHVSGSSGGGADVWLSLPDSVRP